MEREIVELRKKLAQQQNPLQIQNIAAYNCSPGGASFRHDKANDIHDWSGPHEAVAGLLDLRDGFDSSSGYMRSSNEQPAMVKKIEDVVVPLDRVTELFQVFFDHYHPWCPFLAPERTPDSYASTSPLLFWTILSIGARHYPTDSSLFPSLARPVMRLVWSTLADVPQSYHVVKALALLCTWPFPTSSTSTDPTFMLSAMMLQIGLQIGLHRPSHAQDFSKFKVELREGELKDKVRTWAVCNIVAQRVATAYGQPGNTLYDWTLSSKSAISDPNFALPPAIYHRLLIEQFVDKVSKTIYSNPRDALGLGTDEERTTYIPFLSDDLDDLQRKIRGDKSAITAVYLRAAALHLRLSAFFSPPSLPSYRGDLLKLYNATTDFLEVCLNLDSSAAILSLNGNASRRLVSLIYSTHYVFQMMLAAGFALLKLNYSFLPHHTLDPQRTFEMFRNTVFALRSMSVSDNDLAMRLAEVLAQVWKSGRVRAEPNENDIGTVDEEDDSLQLKVRCRMSISLVYDSVWRWREHFQFKGKTLETYLKNPTDPAAGTDSSASSTIAGNTNAVTLTSDPSMASSSMIPGMPGMATGLDMSAMSTGYVDKSYEVFDPLMWMLDGLLDWPYSMTAIEGLEQQGVGWTNDMI